jgi:hypothetical protein
MDPSQICMHPQSKRGGEERKRLEEQREREYSVYYRGMGV